MKTLLEFSFFVAVRYIMVFKVEYNKVTVTLNYVTTEKHLY